MFFAEHCGARIIISVTRSISSNMEVVIAEEPQKKIFRARKTMKISDRQQLESLHNTLASAKPPCPSPVLNGRHPEDGQKETEREKEKRRSTGSSPGDARSVSRSSSCSPTPLALSLSLSPSPPAKTPEESAGTPPSSPAARAGGKSSEGGKEDEGERPASPSGKGGEETEGERKGEEDREKGVVSPEKENGSPKPRGSPAVAASDVADKDGERAREPEGAVAMHTDPPRAAPEDVTPILDKMASAAVSGLPQSPAPQGNTTPTSPSLSPSHAPESDQEVKEGFLVLSEEEEPQGERDEEKGRERPPEAKEPADGEKMEVSMPSAGGEGEPESGAGAASGRKRTISGDAEADGAAGAGGEEPAESQSKRPRVEHEELEAHIELKIRGNADGRHKLEKVVQQLVAEQLRVLQLSVFDRTLQELRDRVEKIDCATKHQHTLQSLQAKIARLTKKFGAANQAKENLRKPQEVSSATAASSSMITASPSPRTVRSMQDSKRPEQSPAPANSSGPAAQSSPASSSSTPALPASALLLPPPPPSRPHPLPPPSLQPRQSSQGLLSGALVSNHSSGTDLGAGSLNKAKTANTATPPTSSTPTTLVQKTIPPSTSSSSPSLARAAGYSSSSGTVATPASAVGATSASSALASSTPAATGGASSGATASAPPSGAAMASKTDSQATVRPPDSTTAKTPAQASRGSRAAGVIDLTEDDDDVLVTGVKKAPVPTVSSVSASSSSSTPSAVSQRQPAAVNSHATAQANPSGSAVPQRSSPQSTQQPNGPQLTVHHRPPQESLSKALFSTRPPATLPPLPPAPGPPPRLPPEAAHTSPPQRPQLKLARVQSQNGIVLSWSVEEADRSCAGVESYHLYAYHQDQSGPGGGGAGGGASGGSQWKKIGEVKALPLPMACTLTQFVSGSKYYFAIRARDVHGRFGPFCEPQCTDVITPPTTAAASSS
ncbi:hypothetical protein GJAV_G00226050 [Gymnothorax javanicus]|nr:hypothetical protein GJAV_G00226050 [Gymnothorax javanicus]